VAAMLAATLLTGCPLFGTRPSDEQEGPLLQIAIPRPFSLDPVALRDRAGILIARQIYEPLVRFDPNTSTLLPGLASSWDVLDGGSRYVFHLRPGARFHNNRAVTGEDVRFALSRLARKSTASETAFLLDSVAGFEQANVTGEANELSGVKAIDDRTVEIKLSAPWFDFPYILTSPATSPVPKSEFEANPAGFGERPIGNGPYQMAAPFRAGMPIRLKRFIGYRGPKVRVRSITFIVYDQPEAAWRDFEERKVDVAEAPPGRIAFAEAKYGSAGFTPLAAGLYMAFNLRNSKFGDIRFRKAVSLSINREPISRSIYADALTPAHGLVPPGIPGGGDPVCGADCTRNVEGAKGLLNAMFPKGDVPEVAYDFPAGVADEALAGSLQASLSEAGIKVTPRPRERELHAFLDLLQSRQQEMFRLAWVAEYPLEDWFISPLFKSGSTDNHTSYGNADIDSRIAKARATPDFGQRQAQYTEIEKKVVADLTVIPIGFFRNHQVAGSRVRDFYVDSLGGFDVSRLAVGS
jgi:oligopeptide transport system substrate-binding protein